MKKIIDNEKTTKRVLELKEVHSVDKLAEMLDMSKVTMYKRLESGEWKLSERAFIQTIE